MANPERSGTINRTLGEIAALLQGVLDGPGDLQIERITGIETGDPNALGFAESAKYLARAKSQGIGALLVPNDLASEGVPCIRVENPRMAFFHLLHLVDRPYPIQSGIHPTAVIDPRARVDESANIGPYAVIDAFAVVGPRVVIMPHVYVGEFCEIGAGTRVLPNAVLVRNVTLGENCLVHSGAVLGADGFGFAYDGKHRIKIPQVGSVTIGDNVEIGANSAVDRATAGATIIGSGTKLDNLVQIGHNSRLGTDCAVAGHVGIAGSTTVGDRVVFGGQAGTRDHITIGNDINIGGRGGVSTDILEPGDYLGSPAIPALKGIKNLLLQNRLSELFNRLRALEKKVGIKS